MITLCEQLNDRHYELLALADESQHAVNDYATRGQVYVYQQIIKISELQLDY